MRTALIMALEPDDLTSSIIAEAPEDEVDLVMAQLKERHPDYLNWQVVKKSPMSPNVAKVEGPRIDFRQGREARILKAYGLGPKGVRKASSPSLFRDANPGDVFVCRDERSCYVAVKANRKPASSGCNALVIGGKFVFLGGYHDFAFGAVQIGFPGKQVVFKVAGSRIGERSRRALRNE